MIAGRLARPHAGSGPKARRSGARGVYFIVEPCRSGLNHLSGLAETGQLRTVPGRVFPLSERAAAFEALAHQHVRGKLVLAVRPAASWAD